MKPTKEQVKTWVKALRSGQFKQTKNRLQDAEGYCCLGVACELFIEPHEIERSGDFLVGGIPSDQVNSPTWLNGIISDFQNRTGKYLTRLNDDGVTDYDEEGIAKIITVPSLSFDEIADLLELVYIHDALEDYYAG